MTDTGDTLGCHSRLNCCFPAMARRSSALPSSLRRTKMFVWANLVLWGVIGGWYLFQPAERQADVSRLVRNAFDSGKQISAFDVGWDLWQLYASNDYVGAVASGDRTHLYGGQPRGLQSDAQRLRVLANTGYVVGYDDELGSARWAAYRVRDVDDGRAPPRPEGFDVDPRTSARVESIWYSKSGYDRGHLAPNYAIATRYGREAQRETFLMSNITPQKHALNAGPWERMEQRIAKNYAGRFGEVWVINGPIFGKNPERLQRRVAVPEAFFLIVVDEAEGKVRTQAFVMPQGAGENDAPEKFLASIDEVETRTGLDFLSELPDEAENALETRRVERVW